MYLTHSLSPPLEINEMMKKIIFERERERARDETHNNTYEGKLIVWRALELSRMARSFKWNMTTCYRACEMRRDLLVRGR